MRDNTTEIVPDDHGELTEAEWLEYCRMTTSTAARSAARRKAANLAAFNRDQTATAKADVFAGTVMTQHEILINIRNECERLAKQSEGMPFTGRSVGNMLGELFAFVAALAVIIDKNHPQE